MLCFIANPFFGSVSNEYFYVTVQGNNEDGLRNDIQNLEDTPNETDDAETDYDIDSILSDIFWIYLQSNLTLRIVKIITSLTLRTKSPMTKLTTLALITSKIRIKNQNGNDIV